jgi:hypothetical protein
MINSVNCMAYTERRDFEKEFPAWASARNAETNGTFELDAAQNVMSI